LQGCPNGLHFSKKHKICESPSQADCIYNQLLELVDDWWKQNSFGDQVMDESLKGEDLWEDELVKGFLDYLDLKMIAKNYTEGFNDDQ